MVDEKKIDTSTQHFEHSLSEEPTVPTQETEKYRDGFSLRRIFHRPNNNAFFQEALDKYGEDGAISPEAERRLVKKLDWTIIPVNSLSGFLPSGSSAPRLIFFLPSPPADPRNLLRLL